MSITASSAPSAPDRVVHATDAAAPGSSHHQWRPRRRLLIVAVLAVAALVATGAYWTHSGRQLHLVDGGVGQEMVTDGPGLTPAARSVGLVAGTAFMTVPGGGAPRIDSVRLMNPTSAPGASSLRVKQAVLLPYDDHLMAGFGYPWNSLDALATPHWTQARAVPATLSAGRWQLVLDVVMVGDGGGFDGVAITYTADGVTHTVHAKDFSVEITRTAAEQDGL